MAYSHCEHANDVHSDQKPYEWSARIGRLKPGVSRGGGRRREGERGMGGRRGSLSKLRRVRTCSWVLKSHQWLSVRMLGDSSASRRLCPVVRMGGFKQLGGSGGGSG